MLWQTLLAHAAPINYKFPLPIWLYVVAGGAAVLLSAPAAALGVRIDPRERVTRNLYPLVRPLHLRAIVLTAFTVLLLWAFLGGFGAGTAEAHLFFENPLTVLAWVDFWVGLGLLATFVGNVWEFVSPLNAAARTLDRALARRGIPRRLYPAALGRWPAVVLILVWSWMELIWPPAKNPPVLAAILAGYFGLTLVGTAVFGSEAWLGNAELFTVFSRTFARFAPLAFTPAEPQEWLAASPDEREVRLRPFGAGIRTEPPLPAGGGAFVIVLLATVVDDGFSQTRYFSRFGTWMITHSAFFAAHVQILVTLILLTITAIFISAYLLVCALMSGGRNVGATARVYAPTLVPIAAVYFVAHYFTYLLIAGQATLGTLVDPWGHSWNPWGLGEYAIQKGFLLPAAVWWTEVLIIVWGHVVAVIEAHRVGLAREVRPRRALAFQLPLVALMVAYTAAGLYVLALQIKGG